MIRLRGLSRAIREAFPPEFAPLYEAVTRLGGGEFLVFGLALLYWLAEDRRREVAVVVGYALAAYAVVFGLKVWFALPRPPPAAHLIAESGYGFPSGHAVAATVVYGGLVAEFDRLDDPRAVAAAVAVVGAVSLSRVVLGVHYLGDVLAGLLVGLAVLAGARAVGRRDPTRAFALGAVLSLPAVAVTGARPTALGILGGCLGGVAGSRWLDAVPRLRSRARLAALAVGGVAFVVATRAAGEAAAAVPLGPLLDDLVLVAGVVLLPGLVAHARRLLPGGGER